MPGNVLTEYELNTAQAASYLQISVGHLYNLRSKEKAPRHIRYGGQLRFRRDDLDEWIAQRCNRTSELTSELLN